MSRVITVQSGGSHIIIAADVEGKLYGILPPDIMTDLPILVSIPHGGSTVPPEVAHRIRLTPDEIVYYGDPDTSRLYDFGEMVAAVVSAPVSRVVVDVNRAPGSLPPKKEDGAVKTKTIDGTPIWHDAAIPDRRCMAILLDRYYYPFHYRLKHVEESGQVVLGLDCHSMLPRAPDNRQEATPNRPAFCLSNGGDRRGDPADGDVTCPPRLLRILARVLEREFETDGRIALNDPFTGGFICRFHHRRHGLPWIQVEVNRDLYEAPGSHDGGPVPGQMDDVNRRLAGVLSEFWETARDIL